MRLPFRFSGGSKLEPPVTSWSSGPRGRFAAGSSDMSTVSRCPPRASAPSRSQSTTLLMYFTVSWRQHDICGCPSLRPAGWRVTIATRCVHASTISDPTSPIFDLHWSIGPHPQDRRQALHQRTLAHQRSCGTPCGIREWVPAPVTDSEGGTVMPRAQDPYVNASRYLAAAITSFTPERHLLGK